jgi:hypothetical protein
MNLEDHIKLFGMSHALVEREIDKVEKHYRLDFQRETKDDRDQDYYPQFAHALRLEAASMAKHYELFYCLEKNFEICPWRHMVDEVRAKACAGKCPKKYPSRD